MKRILLSVLFVLFVALGIITIIVQREGEYVQENLGSGTGPRGKALILFHPSRDARFADELTLALAAGLSQVGLGVTRETMTSETPGHPEGYALIVVVSNTYYSAPDMPTMHYLARARFDGIPAIGVIGGAGTTGRAQRLLDEALRHTNARVLGTRAYWLWRPNDESRMNVPNRQVARELATRFAAESGATVAAGEEQQ